MKKKEIGSIFLSSPTMPIQYTTSNDEKDDIHTEKKNVIMHKFL